MDALEELRCLEKARSGDTAAFEALVTANEKFVYTIAYRLLGNQQDAEDAAQEAFLRAYTSLSTFRGDSRFSSWLYRLTANVCTDMLRRRRGTVVSLRVDDDGEDTELDIADTRFDPQDELERKELRQKVSEALQSLPEHYRSVIVMRELGGHSYEEIGRQLSLDSGTVKSRIFRARKKLCEILSADGNIFAADPSNNPKGGVQG